MTNAPRLAAAWAELAPRDPPRSASCACGRSRRCSRRCRSRTAPTVVVLLGAHALGVERLLVAAAAPRLVVVVPPDAPRQSTPTALSVLERAAAPVIRWRVAGSKRRPAPPPCDRRLTHGDRPRVAGHDTAAGGPRALGR
jgi:hypothetical protein